MVTRIWVLFCDRRGHLGAMSWDNFPSHASTHGFPLNVRCLSKPILNSHFAAFITRSSCCKALRYLDSITMAIKLATCAHSSSISLSLLLSVHASHSSFRPLVLGLAQPCLILSTTFSGGGISSLVLSSAPSLSYTSVLSRVMPRHHCM